MTPRLSAEAIGIVADIVKRGDASDEDAAMFLRVQTVKELVERELERRAYREWKTKPWWKRWLSAS
jgi:hypothetical protein